MQIKANPDYRALKAWCAAQRSAMIAAVHAEHYRVAGPRHTSAQAIVSGIGGYKANSRWCRRWTTRLLYLSEAPETAMAESNEHARRNQLPLWEQMPKVTVAIRVDADAVLDLTDAAVAAALPFDLPALLKLDWREDNRRGHER